MNRLPHRSAPYLFGLILTFFMTLIISGIATVRAVGFDGASVSLWMSAWLPSWLVAFPCVLIVAPTARRLVASVTQPPR